MPTPAMGEAVEILNKSGYTVIPPSGTFRDLIGKLDFIISELGCRVIQLLPVHPTPTTYGRMGQFGSPYAALGFLSVDPALAQFDPRATPLEQFIELVDAVHERNALLLIDIAINHTGWAARLHEKHPSWLVRDEDGAIQVPGAWGVKWEDLTKLDYTQKDLWKYMAEVFLTWCHRGVDGFRCDAGYMIPAAAWQYIIAAVREQYPDTIFFNEGLGGKISVTRDLLNRANFNWAYSELFQNFSREQIERYLPEAMEISCSEGLTVHFSETHDNLRLAARSETWARMRTALCALFSQNGAFGFANGVEWYATEKINVHGVPSLNWGAERNQVSFIARLNLLLKKHPAFHDQTRLKLIQHQQGNYVVMLRYHYPTEKWLLAAVNLDDEREASVIWHSEEIPWQGDMLTDLLSGQKIPIDQTDGGSRVRLKPGRFFCLTPTEKDMELLDPGIDPPFAVPERIKQQALRAQVLDTYLYYHENPALNDFDIDAWVARFSRNPENFCRRLNPQNDASQVIRWTWPTDERREVMVPAGHFLLVESHTAFRARIVNPESSRVLAWETSLNLDDGRFYVLFRPQPAPLKHTALTLELTVYSPGKTRHATAPLLFLCASEKALLEMTLDRTAWPTGPLLLLGTNGKGAMMRAPIRWGQLPSRYDALLAANLDPNCPADRWIVFTRCRGWVKFQGHSQDMVDLSIDSFCFDGHSRGCWRFRIPTGQGRHVLLRVYLEMTPHKNEIRMIVYREAAREEEGRLPDDRAVEVILRPDVEWRSFHESTKAYLGSDTHFPQSVSLMSGKSGFWFSPNGPQQKLAVCISRGTFEPASEWEYMVHHSMDGERGFDPDSDLFSPGYFSSFLEGDQWFELTARVSNDTDSDCSEEKRADHDILNEFVSQTRPISLEQSLYEALDHYVVKRGDLKTVIAGYPWFLDWGRDSLIFVRGLVAAGKTDDAKAVLTQFGRFEKDGTLPNMIHGEDAGNRDTSDAALWFFTACGDLLEKEGDRSFLKAGAGGRTIGDVLRSIGVFMVRGTPNGVQMDPESGLIFSPAHYTWMDTNFPTGTPREGYPIEIQALWYRALRILSEIDGEKAEHDWEALATRVSKSISDLFWLDGGFLSDCLHAASGVPARAATPDDALRPNQLLTITLGAVSDSTICRQVLRACEELLVPGAIRSLADRPVNYPIPVVHAGNLLNDPNRPYWGTYAGDEDTRRKPAYHNGTAWTWPFPSFCEAWAEIYGDASRETALSWLSSSIRLIDKGCLGQVPEIVDGDFPHVQRGCDAQAWGVSELLRVWKKLKR